MDRKEKELIASLMAMDPDDLLARLGQQVADAAHSHLNFALTAHGGKPIVQDGIVRPMSGYIDADKLPDVLNEARKSAEAAGISLGDVMPVADVVTDNDAVEYVLGYRLFGD